MQPPRLIALLGSSGSGKSEIAHNLALRYDCEIFSLDSLSIYKRLDIVSAKPSKKQQGEVRYHAVDILEPNEPSNAMLFHTLLTQTIKVLHKPLLIVGGSSFFLKSMLEGLSPTPTISQETERWVKNIGSVAEQYAFLQQIDSEFATKIKASDTYRIHRALSLYKATQMSPSQYFQTHPKVPFPYPMTLYSLTREKEELRTRIAKRTKTMIEQGIVNEIESVIKSYGENIPSLQAIGAKECVMYLNGKIPSLQELETQIFHHTCQLAKRQRTFNRTQFSSIIHLDSLSLQEHIGQRLKEIALSPT